MNQKVDHLEHLEDLIFNDFSSISNALYKIGDMIDNNTPISLKIDGSPSIVFGKFENRFYLSTKSFFNKKPKIYYSIEEIDNDIKDKKLVKKLTYAFENLSKINFPEFTYVMQADLLYNKESVQIDEKYIYFTPNTITYKIHKNSSMGESILNSNLGLCVHTFYSGKNDSLFKCHDVKNIDVKNIPEICFFNPTIYTYDLQKLALYKKLLNVYKYLNFIDSKSLYDINQISSSNKIFNLKTYINYMVKKGRMDYYLENYFTYLDDILNNEIFPKMKKNKESRTKIILDIYSFYKKNHSLLNNVFMFLEKIIDFKFELLNQLNKLSFEQFPLLPFFNEIPTEHEGFVYDNFKIVNRLSFSRNNFMKWDKK